MYIKIETAARYAGLDIGDTFKGFVIIVTFPNSPQMIIDVPGDPTAVAQAMVRLVASGDIRDWRTQNTYSVLWLPRTVNTLGAHAIGDTFPMCFAGDMEALREQGRYGAGVAVLVCDTGVEASHEAFAGKQVFGDRGDQHGHGTHVASTAASGWGLASDAVIYSAAVLPGGSGTEAGIARGIRRAVDWAVAQGGRAVLNLSLGGNPSSVMDDACIYAKNRQIPVVAAAGNAGPGAAIGSPARAADLIILACDRERQYADFSSGPNWGTVPNRVTAPGTDIVAANGPGGGSMSSSGTSMACPHVAGLVALLLGAGYSR